MNNPGEMLKHLDHLMSCGRVERVLLDAAFNAVKAHSGAYDVMTALGDTAPPAAVAVVLDLERKALAAIDQAYEPAEPADEAAAMITLASDYLADLKDSFARIPAGTRLTDRFLEALAVLEDAADDAVIAANDAADDAADQMLAEMTTSLDRLKESFTTTPAGYPLREQVVEAIAKAQGWLVEAEDRARHLSYTVGNPAVLAKSPAGGCSCEPRH